MLNGAYLDLHAIPETRPHMFRDLCLDQAIAIDHCRGDEACAENYDGEGERDPICSVVPSVRLGNGTFQCDCSLTDRASQNCSSILSYWLDSNASAVVHVYCKLMYCIYIHCV